MIKRLIFVFIVALILTGCGQTDGNPAEKDEEKGGTQEGRIVENLGLVKGHTIYAVSLGKDLSALLRLIPGGELVEYTEHSG